LFVNEVVGVGDVEASFFAQAAARNTREIEKRVHPRMRSWPVVVRRLFASMSSIPVDTQPSDHPDAMRR
jgi:hypothetical protein